MTIQILEREWAFEAGNFPSLSMREDLTETWNELGLASLSPREQEGISRLLDYSGISSQSNYDRENVLLVKAIDGIPQQVYGPAIFRCGNDIVLKIGGNQAIVTQKDNSLVVGDLKGNITVVAKENIAGKKYPVATVNLVGSEDIFEVRLSLNNPNNDLTVARLNSIVIKKLPILPYLTEAPSMALKMQELGLGEFEVRAISSGQNKYGTSYKLHLANGQVVFATGNSQIMLADGYQMTVEKPLTLVVVGIEEVAEGKFRVHNALRERLPRLAPVTASTASETIEAIVFESEAEPEEESEDLDTISF